MQKVLRFFLVISICLTYQLSSAVLPDGSNAPNWTVTDLNGNQHTLYDYLDDGKMVVIDFFATWCGPCWNYHQGHALEDLYNTYGPNGSNEVMVFGLEVDMNTNDNCMYGQTGCSGTSIGDWTAGVSYPQSNVTDPSIGGGYSISYYPSIVTVCPDKLLYESGQITDDAHATWIGSCKFDLELTGITDVQCFENHDGAVDIETIEGYGFYSYDWSTGATTPDLLNVDAGTYSVTVTEGHGRTAELHDLIVGGPITELNIATTISGEVECFGGTEGFVNTTSVGGTPGYSFAWSSGQSTPNIANLTAGVYTLTVTDGNGCQKMLDHEVIQPDLLTLELVVDDEDCDAANGQIVCDPGGGSPGYMFDIGYGPSPSQVIPGLVAGDYSVTVTDDHGCFTVKDATVVNNPPPDAEAGPEKSLDCDNSSVTLEGTGTTGSGISIVWSTDGGNIVEGENTLTPTVDAAGTYTIEITDNNTGCVSADEVVVNTIGEIPDADAGEDKALDCTLMSTELDGSGSSSGSSITYTWTTDDGNIVEGNNTTTPLIDAAGTYKLTVHNSDNGCETEALVVVTEDFDAPEPDVMQPGKIDCNNSIVQIDASGSSSGDDISYTWTTDDGNITEGAETTMPTVDEGGIYTLEILNSANGCSAAVDVQVIKDVVTPVIDGGGNKTITCNESQVSLEATSDGDYSYAWDTDDGNIVEGENSLGPIVDQAGEYTFTAVNPGNGCTASATVVVDIDQDVPVANAGESAELTCEKTSISLNGLNSDAGASFSYSWTTDDGNIVEGATTLEPVIDAPGIYTLWVTNTENNCTSSANVEITEFINEPVAEFDFSTDELEVTLSNVSSGQPFSYHWDFGDENSSEEANPSHVYSASGVYSVCLTIENECGSNTICYDVAVAVSGITVEHLINHVRCFEGSDGSISINITEGNAPFTFSWSNDETTSVISDLSAGIYELTITDNEDKEFDFNFEIIQPDPIEVFDVQVINQINSQPGSVTINVRGGVDPYTFKWSDGSSSQNLETAVAGDYELTVIDDNGCEVTVGPFTISDVTAVDQIDNLNRFDLFPNPSNGHALVSIAFDKSEDFQVSLFSLQGRQIQSWKYEAQDVQIDLKYPGIASGMYILRVETKEGIALKKWIVQ